MIKKIFFKVTTKEGTEEVLAEKVSIDSQTATLLFLTEGKLVVAFNPGSWVRLEVGWERSYQEALICPKCGFQHIIGADIIETISLNQIGEDQMSIDFGEEKPPLT